MYYHKILEIANQRNKIKKSMSSPKALLSSLKKKNSVGVSSWFPEKKRSDGLRIGRIGTQVVMVMCDVDLSLSLAVLS